MSETVKIHVCPHCDYKSTRKQSVTRHAVTKHLQSAQVIPMPNAISPMPNVIFPMPNVISDAQNVIIPAITGTGKECMKCHRIFARRSGMLKHAEKCVWVANKQDIQDIQDIQDPTATPESPQQEQEQAQSIDPSITNSSIAIGESNSTTNVIIFKPDTLFLYDHITKHSLLKIVHNDDCPAVLSTFSEELLKRNENLCIRKTDLQSATSTIHVGNNVWEVKPDHLVMPLAMGNVAMTLIKCLSIYEIGVNKTLAALIGFTVWQGKICEAVTMLSNNLCETVN